jgi:hypothetical protein
MKRLITKFCLLFFLLVPFSTLPSLAQNLTGIWRGTFFTENGSTYKFELQIKQTSNAISGVSYSYLSTIFYGKAVLTGNYNRSGKTALVREIKTTELRMSDFSTACIMKCVFEYSKSGKEEFLEGTFTSKYEHDGFGFMKGEDCGGGNVMLRKVNTSDFYVEPFLRKTVTPTPPVRNNLTKPKTSPPVVVKKPPVVNKPLTKPPVKTTTNKPVAGTKPGTNKPVVVTKPVTNKPVTTTKPPANKPVVKKPDPVVVRPVIDSAQKITSAPVVKKDPQVQVATPNALKNRANELVKTLVVKDENVIVKLYDNGEIDDDTISVYLDKKLVLSAKRLTASPLVIKFKIDEDDADHELVMVAENLGRIPPNTSLMIVESGEQRFDVRITSTEQKNAVVRFRYQK